MHTLWQDMRYALRLLTKNPGFGAIAVFSLALGIGANTTIFTVINAILLHPLPVKEISRVVQVDTIDTKTRVTAANATKLGMSFPNFQDYARNNQVFAALGCTVGPLPLTWSGGVEPRQIFGQLVSANYFEILGMHPAAGRFFLPDEDTKLSGNDVAVLSYSLWANKFGSDPYAVGKILTLNATPYTVIGVAPRGFKGAFTFGNAEQVWIPVSMYPQVLAGFFKDYFNDRRFLTTIMFGPGAACASGTARIVRAAFPVPSWSGAGTASWRSRRGSRAFSDSPRDASAVFPASSTMPWALMRNSP